MNDKKFNKWFSLFILIGMAVVTVVVTAIKFKDADSGKAMLLISAFVGGDWHTIYDYALAHDFRFLSYGDSSLLFRR